MKELLDAATEEELEAIIASLEASAYRLAEVMYASLDLDSEGDSTDAEDDEIVSGFERDAEGETAGDLKEGVEDEA